MGTEKLTPLQQKMVEDNMQLVKWVIRDHITANVNVAGLGHADLFQQGCLGLIQAAMRYDHEKSGFETFARHVVRNVLIDYCRKVSTRQKHVLLSGIPADTGTDFGDLFNGALDCADDTLVAEEVEGREVIRLLESLLPEYEGITRKGIEAIILKTRGYNGAYIAQLYGVDRFNVGAWISRAKSRLLCNERFLSFLLPPAA